MMGEDVARGDSGGGGSRPPVLPPVAGEAAPQSGDGVAAVRQKALDPPNAPGRTGYENPLVGTALGEKLASRIGSLLSRPCYKFANSLLWMSGRGAAQDAHLDRPVLDVTMSIPVVLDGADRWPLWAKKPDGSRFEWAGAPGSVLILDGRHRMHGRCAFEGTRSIVLLLHWTMPAGPVARCSSTRPCGAKLRRWGGSFEAPRRAVRCSTAAWSSRSRRCFGAWSRRRWSAAATERGGDEDRRPADEALRFWQCLTYRRS